MKKALVLVCPVVLGKVGAIEIAAPDWSNFEDLVSGSSWCEVVQRSSLWDPECRDSIRSDFDATVNLRPLLVTGVGRSGTEYVTKLLSAAGMKVRASFLKKHAT